MKEKVTFIHCNCDRYENLSQLYCS